jgi:hypothetical protein
MLLVLSKPDACPKVIIVGSLSKFNASLSSFQVIIGGPLFSFNFYC